MHFEAFAPVLSGGVTAMTYQVGGHPEHGRNTRDLWLAG